MSTSLTTLCASIATTVGHARRQTVRLEEPLVTTFTPEAVGERVMRGVDRGRTTDRGRPRRAPCSAVQGELLVGRQEREQPADFLGLRVFSLELGQKGERPGGIAGGALETCQ